MRPRKPAHRSLRCRSGSCGPGEEVEAPRESHGQSLAACDAESLSSIGYRTGHAQGLRVGVQVRKHVY